MTNEELRERLAALDDEIRVRKDRFVALRDANKDAEADALREDSRQICLERHGLAALAAYRQTVPIAWTHNADESEIERAVKVPALIAASTECADGSRNLLAIGPTGIGKSTSIALLARRFYVRQQTNRFRRVRWLYARDLAAAALEHPLGQGESPEVRAARAAPVLVVDDLGLEKDHGVLLDVLHERYESGRTVWVSSGLTLSQLRDRYGEAIVRRLVEGQRTPGRIVSCFKGAQPAAVGGA